MNCRFIAFILLNLALTWTAGAASRLTNVSVRSVAGADADTLIVGFTIDGAGSKQMLIRGIGPTLADFGVAGVVTDPELKLFNQANVPFSTNDNWGGSATTSAAFLSVGAFGLKADSRDAALFLSLPAGSYSAHLAANSNNGVALVEAYDADGSNSATRISNVSARSVAETGAGVLTIGFAITGDTTKTVLIRAVGPSLTPLGVTGALANPQLKLFGQGSIDLGGNDDWPNGASWSGAFTSVGAFPLALNTRDAAMLVKLPPGTYTAQASGVGNTRGVALIEVYDVSNPPAASFVLEPIDNTVAATAHARANSTGALDVQPVPIVRQSPTYPFELRRAGLSGDVTIQFVISANGTVPDAIVVRATDVRLAEAAVAAVRTWTFTPGRRNGQPVQALLQVPIVFTLTN